MNGVAVDVCVDVPRLELDRPFTYLLPDGVEEATGHLVSVPFHGRTVKGWVLGPARELPRRVVRIRGVLSAVPLFGERDLELYRWIAARYVVPLATVISRASPPRIASEEKRDHDSVATDVEGAARVYTILPSYDEARPLLEGGYSSARTIAMNPSPDDELDVCLEAVDACLATRRDALVVVPEAEPLPATARAVLERFGDVAVSFVGGDER
ncbi:MAG TPA: hypothetical protein VG709_06790, partial [Actinomycetota bacterium]|nr:hypothetical protein [Actinomycetota bacterium]